MTPSGPTTGSTSSVTPVLRVSKAVGVVGVTGKAPEVAPVRPPAAADDDAGVGAIRNLRRIELRRVTEFAHDLDHGALAALGRDARGGEKIDAFLLVQRADDDLELRVGEDAAQAEDAGRERAGARDAEEERIDRVRADGEIAAAIAAGDRETADRLSHPAGQTGSRSG